MPDTVVVVYYKCNGDRKYTGKHYQLKSFYQVKKGKDHYGKEEMNWVITKPECNIKKYQNSDEMMQTLGI